MKVIGNPRNFHSERMAALKKANACLAEIVRATRDAARSKDKDEATTLPAEPRTKMEGEAST